MIFSTTTADGVYTLSLKEPDDRCLFVPLWFVSDRYRREIGTSGLDLVAVRREVMMRGCYYARAGDDVIVRFVDWLAMWKWSVLRLLWRLGVVEAAPEAVIGPVRFRPFPWRGTYRRYS